MSGSKDARYSLKVNLDGTILFPEIGFIAVVDQSLQDVRDKISALINQSYVGVNTDISIKDLAYKIAKEVGFNGEIVWDHNKPDGTPRKKLDTTIINNLGWEAKIDLDLGIRNTISELDF